MKNHPLLLHAGLILAKERGFDVFNALDIMENKVSLAYRLGKSEKYKIYNLPGFSGAKEFILSSMKPPILYFFCGASCQRS